MARLLNLVLLSAFATLALMAQADEATDLHYDAALYNFHLGQYAEARNILMQQGNQDTNVNSLLLLARVFVEEKNYEQARQVFASVQLKDVPVDLRNKALMALARMYFAEGSCEDTFKVLKQTGKLDSEQDAYKRFLEVSCMVLQEPTDKQVSKAEKLLVAGIKPGLSADITIWFSYAYYNIATVAAQINQLEWADRLFEEALLYTGASQEGLALTQRIHLSKARVRFLDNRFDYALETYQSIPFDSYWQDEALLGFGWAAFRNYQVSRALEAWWQLANLPYKSLDVYRAYLLIPYVYEQSNAYAEALRGYERAIDEFEVLLQEMAMVDSQITVDRVHQHAVHYYLNPDDLDPIHPLLAKTYTELDFRLALEKVGKLTSYQEKLTQYQYLLSTHEDYQRKFVQQSDARERWREGQQQSIMEQLNKLDKQLNSWIDALLEKELAQEGIRARDKAAHQTYQQIKQRMTRGSSESDAERMRRIQGVLLSVATDNARSREGGESWLEDLNQVSVRQQKLQVRFSELQAFSNLNLHSDYDETEVAEMQRQVADLLLTVESVLQNVLADLVAKTKGALQQQHDVVVKYEKQARIARANLREEFFQQGGGRLWY